MRITWRDRFSGSKGGERRRPLRTCLSLEALERRELLSADVSAHALVRAAAVRTGDLFARVLYAYNVTYFLSVTNHGDAAEPVVLTNVLDPRLDPVYVDVLNYDGQYTTSRDDAGVLTVTFPALDEDVSLEIRTSVPLSPAESSAPPITFNYSITTAEPNENPQTGGSITVDAPSPIADVSLTHQSNPEPIPQGIDVDYPLVITNHSTFAVAPDARIFVRLPKGNWSFSLSGDQNSGWEPVYETTRDPGPPWGISKDLVGYAFQVGDLAPGESRTVPITMLPRAIWNSSLTVNFTASATSGAYDPDASNNAVDITTQFAPTAYITLNSIAASPFPTRIGRDLTYRLDLKNLGPNDATGVVVHQALPAGATFAAAALRGEFLTGVVENGMLTIALPDGSVGPLSVALNTAGMAARVAAEPISVPVEVTWNEYPGSLSGVAMLGSVAPSSYVGSLLEERDASIGVHQYQSYSYTLNNPDTFAAKGLTAILTFPPASVMALAPGNYTVEQTPTSQIVTFRVGELAAGETRPLHVEAVALSPAAEGFHVVARLVQDGRPENYYRASSVTTTINPAVRLVATLSPYEQTPEGNKRTITVTNQGPNTATGVKLEWKGPGPLGPTGAPDLDHPFTNESLTVGTLEVGQTAVLDATDLNMNQSYYYDGVHAVANEVKAPPADSPYGFVTWLGADVASIETGGLATFTARTINIGPVDAKDLRLISEIPANARLVSVSPGVIVVGRGLELNIADLPVGAEAGFQFVVSPTWDALGPGVLFARASVSPKSHGVDPSHDGQTSLTVPVTAGPSGALVPGSPSYEAPENAGAIVVTVNRVGGANGPLSINYATEAVDAVAGVDYVPVSGTLVFEDGETSKTITAPILDNPSSAVDRTVRLVFSNGQTTLLIIRDVDHQRAMPPVADVQWVGPPRGIAAIQVELARPMPDPSVFDPSAFALTTARPGLMRGARGGRPIPLRSVYDPAISTVVLTPRRPLPANLFYHLTVAGGGPTPGSDYSAELARGRSLRYLSTTGDLVSLRLRGRGYIDALLVGPEQDERLSVVSLGPRQASVSRRVVQVHPRGFGLSRFQPPMRPILARGWFATTATRGAV